MNPIEHQSVPEDIGHDVETIERQLLMKDPEAFRIFSGIIRQWLYKTLSPQETETRLIDGYRVTSFKK